ncbi:uncharacterized protein [Venturia canescens]|uniref:uncharacterized protein n=1 Tax=Venturia canescens TaxID=32260 RepID=UPI001C9C463D|nr:uncharacterized protein LOC122418904 [Venturia canescens]
MRSLFAVSLVTLCITINSHALVKLSHGKTPPSDDLREQDQHLSPPAPLVEDMTELFRNIHSLCKAYSLMNRKPANATTILEPATNCMNTFPEIAKLCGTLDSIGVPEATRCTFSPTVKNHGFQLVSNLARNYSLNLPALTNMSSHDHVISPLSSFIYMAMISYASPEGSGFSGLPKNKMKMAKLGFHQFLKYMGDHGVRIKTKIFTDHDVTQLDPNFIKVAKRIFHSEIETVDVIDGSMGNRKINEWIAAQTNSSVAHIFEPRNLEVQILIQSGAFFSTRR